MPLSHARHGMLTLFAIVIRKPLTQLVYFSMATCRRCDEARLSLERILIYSFHKERPMPTRPRPQRPAPAPSDGALVATALSRAAQRLGVNNKTLARVVGLSEASVSRLRRGDYPLENKPFELGVLFLRLFRSLDALS